MRRPPIAAAWANVAVAHGSAGSVDVGADGWSPRIIAVAADRVAVLRCRTAAGDAAPQDVEAERMLLLAGLMEIASLDLGSTGDTGDAVTQLIFRGGGQLEFVSARTAMLVRAVRAAVERVEEGSDSQDRESGQDSAGAAPLVTEAAGGTRPPVRAIEGDAMPSTADSGDALSQWLARNRFEYIMPHLRDVGAA